MSEKILREALSEIATYRYMIHGDSVPSGIVAHLQNIAKQALAAAGEQAGPESIDLSNEVLLSFRDSIASIVKDLQDCDVRLGELMDDIRAVMEEGDE